eukprot:scaffold230722_cov22-Prasinocladus_malaysianus.AAC.3
MNRVVGAAAQTASWWPTTVICWHARCLSMTDLQCMHSMAICCRGCSDVLLRYPRVNKRECTNWHCVGDRLPISSQASTQLMTKPRQSDSSLCTLAALLVLLEGIEGIEGNY